MDTKRPPLVAWVRQRESDDVQSDHIGRRWGALGGTLGFGTSVTDATGSTGEKEYVETPARLRPTTQPVRLGVRGGIRNRGLPDGSLR
jgi:hypothetical protein